MKPIDEIFSESMCPNCGGCMGQGGLAQFNCNLAKDYHPYSEACTLEDWKRCPLNKEAK